MPNTIEWSEEEMQLLINLRKERNEDYWRRFGRSKVPFWNEIAAKSKKTWVRHLLVYKFRISLKKW